MDYPESILPSSHHIVPFPLKELNPAEHSVSRRIEGKLSDKMEVIGGRQYLDPDCLGVIVGMSVNLLGGPFEPTFTSLRQTGEGKAPWDGESDICLENFEGCYNDTGYDYVFYRVDLLHGAEYPQKYRFEKKESYKAYQQFMEREV